MNCIRLSLNLLIILVFKYNLMFNGNLITSIYFRCFGVVQCVCRSLRGVPDDAL